MDKKSKIINSVLLLIIGISAIFMISYGLIYIYNILGLNIFNGSTLKSNIGDFIIFIATPIIFIIFIFYKACLKRYNYLISLEDNKVEDLENLTSNKDE